MTNNKKSPYISNGAKMSLKERQKEFYVRTGYKNVSREMLDNEYEEQHTFSRHISVKKEEINKRLDLFNGGGRKNIVSTWTDEQTCCEVVYDSLLENMPAIKKWILNERVSSLTLEPHPFDFPIGKVFSRHGETEVNSCRIILKKTKVVLTEGFFAGETITGFKITTAYPVPEEQDYEKLRRRKTK